MTKKHGSNANTRLLVFLFIVGLSLLGISTFYFANMGNTPDIDSNNTALRFKQDKSKTTVERITIYPAYGDIKSGSNVTVTVTWDTILYGGNNHEKLNIKNAPILTIRFGTGSDIKVPATYGVFRTLTYTYTVTDKDEGLFNIIGYSGGTVYDYYGNLASPSINGIKSNKLTAIKTVVTSPKDDENNNTDPDSNKETPTQEVTLHITDKGATCEKVFANDITLNGDLIIGATSAMPTLIKNKDAIIEEATTYLKDSGTANFWDLVQLIVKIVQIYSNGITPGNITHTNIKEIAYLTSINYTSDSGPIGITPATLKKTTTSKEEDVYIVSLGGTQFKDGQATDIITDVLSGLELNNDYLEATYKAIFDNIPICKTHKTKLIIAGISLGGMVAQQLAAQPAIQQYFDIEYVLAFGSPMLSQDKRPANTVVRRFADKHDIIPMLSISNFSTSERAKYDVLEKVIEDGGYKTPIGAHALSYVDSTVWNTYDVLGTKGGNATLTYDLSKTAFFDAPKVTQK